MSGNCQGNVREFWTNSNVATLKVLLPVKLFWTVQQVTLRVPRVVVPWELQFQSFGVQAYHNNVLAHGTHRHVTCQGKCVSHLLFYESPSSIARSLSGYLLDELFVFEASVLQNEY